MADIYTSVVSVVHPRNSSGESRLQVLSSAGVTEMEWENSSESYQGYKCNSFHQSAGSTLPFH